MTTYPEPTLIFENPELTVRAFSVSEMDNSVYLITMRATGEQVLIDPADDAEELYAFTLDALLKDCPQLELADGEERRVRVMEKEEDFKPSTHITKTQVLFTPSPDFRTLHGVEFFKVPAQPKTKGKKKPEGGSGGGEAHP